MDAFKTGVAGQFDSLKTIKMIVMIVFFLILTIVYVVLWLPLVRNINNQVKTD